MNDIQRTLAQVAARAEQIDLNVGRRMARRRGRLVVRAAAKAGKLGDQEPLYALAAGITAAGLILRRPRLARAGAEMALAVLAADLVKSALKRSITRSRPHVLLDEQHYERGPGGSDEKPLQSFPSGHVAGAMAAAAALRRSYRGSSPYGLVACALLAWSRISKAAHWPIDVVAGALAGLAAEAVTARLAGAVVTRWQDRNRSSSKRSAI